MALSIAISKSIFRQDSTILPVITASGAVDIPYIKIHDWQYLKYIDPIVYLPPNRTLKTVPVVMRDCFFGSGNWTLDADIQEGVGATLERTANSGFQGAIYNTPLNATKGSFQVKIADLNLSAGISVQDSSGTIVHNYGITTVAHSMTFGQGGVGSIREKGAIAANNGIFKFEVDDVALMEWNNGIFRYYLVKPSGEMRLIRATRSKLTTTPKAEVLLFFPGSTVRDVYMNSNSEASTSFENVAVAYQNLFWQKWNNQRSISPIGDTLEMADKRTQFTYPNSKTELRSVALTPRSKSRADRIKIEDFYNWHKNDREFIFVDRARKDADGNFEEWFAKFQTPITDQTINGCLFDQGVTIVEDFRNDYVLKEVDAVYPTISLDPVVPATLTVAVNGNATDNVLLSSVQLYLNGVAYGSSFLPAADGTFSQPVNKSAMVIGVNVIWALATDYAGNAILSNFVNYTRTS